MSRLAYNGTKTEAEQGCVCYVNCAKAMEYLMWCFNVFIKACSLIWGLQTFAYFTTLKQPKTFSWLAPDLLIVCFLRFQSVHSLFCNFQDE